MYLINMVRTQIPRMEQNASTMIDLWGASHDVIQRAKTTKEDCNELAEEISLVLKVRGGIQVATFFSDFLEWEIDAFLLHPHLSSRSW
ncbi:uncharacterized protein LOC109136358 isoform X2 [Beta vulgaris subsp. vulgaris]|uniref:uncharacterized protein LOC109136358 isoform X2 n=1 Tax=Beta vulgaris subsp. vulgaris TaxID=3555 RepID=UPI0025468645|nr:uncharacterized protein LOC109136358 isoform X2 [Beta vulgaris subsp. vulgaris]